VGQKKKRKGCQKKKNHSKTVTVTNQGGDGHARTYRKKKEPAEMRGGGGVNLLTKRGMGPSNTTPRTRKVYHGIREAGKKKNSHQKKTEATCQTEQTSLSSVFPGENPRMKKAQEQGEKKTPKRVDRSRACKEGGERNKHARCLIQQNKKKGSGKKERGFP